MAAKIPPVTKAQYEACDTWNRKMVEKFLMQQQLSDHTLKQYKSAARIFLRYIHDEVENRPIHKLKARHALDYQNYLMSLGLSSNGVKFKRSVVSSLCNYIELYYGEDYPEFRNIFNKAIPNPPKAFKKEKAFIEKDDFEMLIKTLEEQEEWQMVAYLLLSYASGARRSEVAQAKKDFFNIPKYKDKDFYICPPVRGKGKGKEGKAVKMAYDDRTRDAVLKWLEIRGEDDCEYVFVFKTTSGRVEPLNPDAFNGWFKSKFNKILGSDLFAPHSIRRSRASHMVIHEGKDIKAAQALLGHNSSETTEIYVLRDDSDDLDDAF